MQRASLAVIFHDQKVLLIERRDVPVWVLPGGGIEPEETPEAAAVREVKEETGLDVTVRRKVGLWLPVNKIASEAHLFECAAGNVPETLQATVECLRVAFWPLDALPKNCFFLHREWIEAARQNVAPIVAKMDKLTYLNCLKLMFEHPIYSMRYLLSRLGLPINRP